MQNKDFSAFPQTAFDSDGLLTTGDIKVFTGLTKREYFAAKALQGVVSNQSFLKNLNAEPKLVATAILEIADELLKQLED